MVVSKNQRAWRDRIKLGIELKNCPQCNLKKLRADSDLICRQCWKKSPEGKAYNQHQVALSTDKFDEVAHAKAIANYYKQELGFVNSAALTESKDKGELEVIKNLAFAHFHHRQDNQTTIYSLAVRPSECGNGWGRVLFYRVLCSAIEHGSECIVAKCPEDLPSNGFYEAMGFSLVKVEPGRVRRLNVWRYQIKLPLLFYCADGGRNQYGRVAREEGWRVGFQSAETNPDIHVQMIDNRYKDYNHQRHLEMVRLHKPLIATVQDIEHLKDLPRIFKQSRELKQYCGRVLLVPKVKCWIPSEFWLGYSIFTSHGGTLIEPEWFGNRFVHLLGGSPKKQSEKAKLMRVISLDGNYAMRLAQYGKVTWQEGEKRIQDLTGEYGCYKAFQMSLKIQKQCWHK